MTRVESTRVRPIVKGLGIGLGLRLGRQLKSHDFRGGRTLAVLWDLLVGRFLVARLF